MKNLIHRVDYFTSLAVTVGTDIKCHRYIGKVKSLATFYTVVIE